MTWVWLAVSVISGTIGDLLSAKGMAVHGEIQDFGPRGIAQILRYIATHRLVIAGIGINAISFFSFLALLSVADLTFAVPATALSYILKTILAGRFLGESVLGQRWAGAVLVIVGIVLISF
jgi:bacterial/archaeal transporter family protein